MSSKLTSGRFDIIRIGLDRALDLIEEPIRHGFKRSGKPVVCLAAHVLVIFYTEDYQAWLATPGDCDRAAQRFSDDIARPA